MKVFVSGGLGYIGSHTCVALLEQGHDLVVVDNLSNATSDVKERIERIAGRSFSFYERDLRDRAQIFPLFEQERFDCIVHFAGYKAVGESVKDPLKYYENNLGTALTLLQARARYGVQTFLFSSSATVYAPDNPMPLTEDMPLAATNPYGWSKLMIEQMIRDECHAHPQATGVLLRYFNPIGAHPSGLLGESPVGAPNNLLPYICQVAEGRLDQLRVFGNDYDTPDGTGVRDYIHVMDLAEGHVAALEALQKRSGLLTYNLGTGRGSSVLDLLRAFEAATGLSIAYQIARRRPGDMPCTLADPSKAEKELGWKAKRSIEEACASAWHFQQMAHAPHMEENGLS